MSKAIIKNLKKIRWNIYQKIVRSHIFQYFYHAKHSFKNSVAIDITYICNLKCVNCQSSIRQAPENTSMSVEQIEKFISEAIRLNYRWNHLDLYGGEPTLHPQFEKVLNIIKKYKDFNPKCVINIISNGTGPVVQKKLSELPDWVIRPEWNEDKGSDFENKDKRDVFDSFNIAPIDTFQYKHFTDFSKGCWRIKYCHGLALSRYGYYPCTPGASIDRVFGFDIGIKNLADVNEEIKRKQLKTLCKNCGLFREPNIKVTEEKMSKTWEKVYKEYKEKKPNMSLY